MSAPLRSLTPATIAGLFVALLLPFATFAVSQAVFDDTQSMARVVNGLVVHWASFAVILFIVRVRERESFASIGVRPLVVPSIH